MHGHGCVWTHYDITHQSIRFRGHLTQGLAPKGAMSGQSIGFTRQHACVVAMETRRPGGRQAVGQLAPLAEEPGGKGRGLPLGPVYGGQAGQASSLSLGGCDAPPWQSGLVTLPAFPAESMSSPP